MARKVAEVEAKMYDVGDRLWVIAPKIHFERPLPKYPVCAAWIKAVEDTATAYASIKALRELLNAKAAELGLAPCQRRHQLKHATAANAVNDDSAVMLNRMHLSLQTTLNRRT
ncbi:MAG TPA: hypothetical protein VGK58_22265 [Lacipirellulaceae bacterium]